MIEVTRKSLVGLMTVALCVLTAGLVHAGSFTVVPAEFDPGKSQLVNAQWAKGIGCPTAASAFIDDPITVSQYDPVPTPYTDPGCATGDAQDKRVEGLLLVKTGPTANNASAVADLKAVSGTSLTELGYDIRKPGAPPDARGSHYGAGAPRFNVVSGGVLYFVGCNSPTATSTVVGTGWVRLKWGGAGSIPAFTQLGVPTDIFSFTIDSISIVFDEGQDASGAPDQFGLAVLDNVNVNGTLVGRGPTGGK
jgi:hypothetical protein